MRHKIIVFIAIVLVIISMAVYGYFSAISGVDDQTDTMPKIEIIPTSFDFGEISYGDVAEHIFEVRNTGNKILEIKKIATSCACTTAEINKQEIKPNETADLTVIYNTGLMSGAHAKGEQERIIYIKSNDPINPQIEVIITAYVN